jgi:hypothetical protein
LYFLRQRENERAFFVSAIQLNLCFRNIGVNSETRENPSNFYDPTKEAFFYSWAAPVGRRPSVGTIILQRVGL